MRQRYCCTYTYIYTLRSVCLRGAMRRKTNAHSTAQHPHSRRRLYMYKREQKFREEEEEEQGAKVFLLWAQEMDPLFLPFFLLLLLLSYIYSFCLLCDAFLLVLIPSDDDMLILHQL